MTMDGLATAKSEARSRSLRFIREATRYTANNSWQGGGSRPTVQTTGAVPGKGVGLNYPLIQT